MKFVKMHGCGNDYVLVDGFEIKLEDPSLAANHLCHRHLGIGADGFILVEPSPSADARMRIFNADGSEAEMCGNGIRCAARLLMQEGRAPSGGVVFETAAGLKKVRECTRRGEEGHLEVDMGRPDFSVEGPAKGVIDLGETVFEGTALSVGNPHFVVFVEDLDDYPVLEYGPRIERTSAFPRGTNVEFVQVLGEGTLRQRTWERGVGETLACGTGAAAVAAAAIRRGIAKSPLCIHLEGGELTVQWDGQGSLFLSGNAVEVFRGEIDLAEKLGVP